MYFIAMSALPMKYLDLLSRASFKAKSIWEGIIEKDEHRLAGRKQLYLSKEGMITLIKSTLSILTTNLIPLFSLSTSVANRIEMLKRNFLWEGMGEEVEFHLVSWSKVCSPITEGGLGVRNLPMFNRAFLVKWF